MEVAKVNNYSISKQEFDAKVQYFMQLNHLSKATPELKQKALWSLIDGVLLLQQAEQHNIEIKKEEIENQMVDHMMEFKSKQAFDNAMQKGDYNPKKYEKYIERKVKIKKFIKANFSGTDIEISDERLKNFYNENKQSFYLDETIRVSHILIDNKNNDAKERAFKIRELINNPEEFKAIANVVSTCPSNAKSGDLGFISKGKMFEEFDETAFALNVNEISQPLESVFGYHIIMVTEKKAAHYVDFEKVKKPLLKRLKAIEGELKLIEFLKDLRAKAGIQISDDLL